MSNIKDLTGQRFGRLVVLEENGRTKRGSVIWKCQCDCGNITNVASGDLQSKTRSCGCLHKEQLSQLKRVKNKYDLSGDYGIGYTQKGETFYFDLEDYDLIKDYCWNIWHGYVVATERGTRKHVQMHNLVTGHIGVDHIGGSTTKNDNRKANLRIPPDNNYSFNTYNHMNKGLNSNNTSGCSGVYWHKKGNKWMSRITVNKNIIYLGTFDNFEDAVCARKAAEEKYFVRV